MSPGDVTLRSFNDVFIDKTLAEVIEAARAVGASDRREDELVQRTGTWSYVGTPFSSPILVCGAIAYCVLVPWYLDLAHLPSWAVWLTNATVGHIHASRSKPGWVAQVLDI